MMLPDKRKPAAGTTGLLKNIEVQGSKFDVQEDISAITERQAFRIRNRFAVSWPVARVTAELHFGRAA